MNWFREHRLPSWILHTALSVLVFALGFTLSEIRAARNGRDAEIERMLRVDYPSLKGEVAVLKIEVAAIDGQQERVETKVEKLTDKIDEAISRLTHIQATLNRLR